jgi:hypothetical protein
VLHRHGIVRHETRPARRTWARSPAPAGAADRPCRRTRQGQFAFGRKSRRHDKDRSDWADKAGFPKIAKARA